MTDMMQSWARHIFWLGISAVFAALLSGCESVVNSVQGAPTREIYPGQVAVGALNVNVHNRVKVTTKTVLGPPSTVYSTTSHSEIYKDTMTTTNTTTAQSVRNTTLENSYAREQSFSGTTEIWKINTDFLTKPTEVVLEVQGGGFMPTATLFVGATERDVLSASKSGYALAPYRSEENLLAGVYVLEPGVSYYMTVQAAGEPVEASYQVGLFTE